MSTDVKILRVIIYLRKSRMDRDSETIEETLRRHEEQLLSYAKKRGLNVVEIKREVVTGDSIAVRPKMQELIDEVEDGLYDAVLVMDIDRLGRGDMIDQGIIINTFKRAGVLIITPDKDYDLADENDEDFFDLSAFFARKELKMIKRRLQRGKIKSLQEGNYIGTNAPYGYDKQSKTLIFNEKERPVVELIFDLYVNQGMGDTKIAKYLESLGIPNKNGNTIWDRTTIRHIIRNPVYTGKVTWDRREYSYSASGKRTSKFLPPSEWKVYPGKHPAIIDEDLFNRAQEISDDRYSPHIHEKRPMKNPLSYIVKCGACGHTMTMRTCKNKPDSLRCYKHCGGVSSAYISLIEERLIEQLYDALLDMQAKFDYHEQTVDINEELIILKNSLMGIISEIEGLEKQKIKQHEAYEKGLYDDNTFLQRSRAVTEELTLVFERKKEIEIKIDERSKEKIKIEKSLPKLLDAKDMIDNYYWRLSPIEKNNFLRSILSDVVYFKEKGADPQDFSLDLTLKL